MGQNHRVGRGESSSKTSKGAAGAALIIGLAGAVAVLTLSVRAHPPTTDVTWERDIAPIVQQRCLGCHGAGGSSSLPLGSYESARAAAVRIKHEVLERRMPPWPAAPGFATFANDRSLSLVEIELLVAWADGGAPKGQDVAGAPAISMDEDQGASPPPPGKQLLLMVPNAASIAGSTETFELTTGLTRDAWVDAWEFRPGNRAAIEQAEISIVGGSAIGLWVPPETRTRLPAGVAQRLPARSRIALRVSYRKSRGPITDRSGVAFSLTAPPRRALRHLQLPCGSSRLPAAIQALAIRPVASRSGLPVEVLARRPDGAVEVLCLVRDYQLRYEVTYRFRQPIPLPAGTEVALHSSEPGCSADLEYVLR
jgi:mono/diheme cytochrome c family protein